MITTVLALTMTSFSLLAQQENQRVLDPAKEDTLKNTITKKLEVKREFELTESMFVSNTFPSDLPQRKDYHSNELYVKVIQGYINTHSTLFVQSEVESRGFSFPKILNSKEEEQQKSSERFKRTTPISEEEKALKRSKESQINN
jgi:hypothetical protein